MKRTSSRPSAQHAGIGSGKSGVSDSRSYENVANFAGGIEGSMRRENVMFNLVYRKVYILLFLWVPRTKSCS